MYRVLVVDDEPLVGLGITTLLNHMEGITVCDMAANGKEALEKIKTYSPHIVITDIKMPIMDGLQLISECQKRYGHNLAFIVLTSYEEFSLIREAISYQVVDYLVKIGLTEEELSGSVNKAIDRLKAYNSFQYADNNVYLKERFYLNLLNQQVPEAMIDKQAEELNINLNYPYFSVAYGTMYKENQAESPLDKKQLDNLYFSSFHMMENILKQYVEVKMISLGSACFVIIFLIDGSDLPASNRNIQDGISDAVELLSSYFSIRTRLAVGSIVKSALQLKISYQEAQRIFDESGTTQILYYRDYLEQIKNDDKKQFYDSVLAYIDNHITEQISLKSVAETFYISPNYLSASFKSYFGVTFVEYVSRKKIEKAKEILLSSNLKIYEVAAGLGFENTYYFSKVFRKVEGMSPREFISSKLL